MDLTVRPFKDSDLDDWLALYAAYYGPEDVIPRPVARRTFMDLLKRKHQTAGYVMCSQDRPIGFAHIIFHYYAKHASKVAYMEDIFISPRFQGQGLGRKLMNHVLADVKTQDCSRLYWIALPDNHANKLFQSFAQSVPWTRYIAELADEKSLARMPTKQKEELA